MFSMNILTNNVRCISKVICGVLKNENSIARSYAIKTDLKIKWNHPGRISCIDPRKSGDLGLNIEVSPTEVCLKYDQSSEMKDISETVKKLFTVEFLPRKETVLLRQEKTLRLVQRHISDTDSMECKIARITNDILQLQEHMIKFRKDVRSKVCLKELIDRRKKFLCRLRKWDYRRFEWLLEKLNLIFKPEPEINRGFTRRDSIRKLTTIYCDKVRQQKLDAYKAELEEEQKTFYKEKAEKLAFIKAEELACGIPVTITEEEIENAMKKAAELNKTA